MSGRRWLPASVSHVSCWRHLLKTDGKDVKVQILSWISRQGQQRRLLPPDSGRPYTCTAIGEGQN